MLGNGRSVGVGIPEGQGVRKGPPRTLKAVAEAKTYAVVWVDEQGTEHTELMHSVGGVWHRAPNGENYAKTLRSLKADNWLVKLLEEKLADSATPTKIPASDDVDITGS